MCSFPRWVSLVVIVLLFPLGARPYSFQTHEQLIDLTWADSIGPLLLKRFPGLTEADLLRAHAYAYGGCAIQDLGYYPFGHEFFSDLTHYVRSADFVQSLFDHAHNANELAFAVGALSHYVGDTIGHADAVNPAVAIEFPNLAKQFGSSVNYSENPHAHVRTEFAFDIEEISKGHLAPSAYLRHVGLRIPEVLLAEVFKETYGLNVRAILGGRRPVIRGYRFSVRSFLPRVAYAENVLHRSGFPPASSTEASRILQEQLARTEFAIGWNQFRRRPGIETHLLAGLIFVLPKIGPLSILAVRGPEAATLEKYIASVNQSTARMRELLKNVGSSLGLQNRDLDTGDRVKPGGYRLTDETYAQLLDAITQPPTKCLPGAIKQNILDYYADPNAPITTKTDRKKWMRVETELAVLRSMNTATAKRKE